MNTLTLVNKFCAHNNFMPDELYTEGSKVVVRYNTIGKYKEYARLISRTHNSNAFRKNNIDWKLDSAKWKISYTSKGGK